MDQKYQIGWDARWEGRRVSPDEVPTFRTASRKPDGILMYILKTMQSDVKPHARLRGPTSCGKTTLARNIGIDVANANYLHSNGILDSYNHTRTELLQMLTSQNETVPHIIQKARDTPELEYSMDGTYIGEVFRDLVELERGEPIDSVPFFQIDLSKIEAPVQIIGNPEDTGEKTEFNRGNLPLVLEASKEGPVVLYLDEVNRAPQSVKGPLFEALDDRGAIRLRGTGSDRERVVGEPRNLITVSAMNQGPGHITEPMDQADKRRLGASWKLSYAGFNPDSEQNAIDPEVEILVNRTQINRACASELVRTANRIRSMANNQDNTDVNATVPTSSLLQWATLARVHQTHDSPFVKAAENAILNQLYDRPGQRAAREAIRAEIRTSLSPLSYNEEPNNRTFEEDHFVCQRCNMSVPQQDVTEYYDENESKMIMDSLKCPECAEQGEQGRIASVHPE